MISGLTDAAIADLRRQFPRLALAEMVARIAGFNLHEQVWSCFASAKYLADEIGRSRRTVFRYFRRLKDLKLLDRIPGSRDYDRMPAEAERPWKLRAHGFSRTIFRGWLAHTVEQERSIIRSRDNSKQRKRREAARARKARAREERIRLTEAKRREIRADFPDLAARAERFHPSTAQHARDEQGEPAQAPLAPPDTPVPD